MSYIIAEVVENVGTITLNDERRRNALSHPLVNEAIAALGSFREAKVRAVILRARQGVKVFSSGHDVSELPELRRDPLGWDDPAAPARARDREFSLPRDRHGRRQRLGWGDRDGAGLRLRHRHRNRYLRDHAGEARRALQCRRTAHAAQRHRAENGEGDDLHGAADRRRPRRAPRPDQHRRPRRPQDPRRSRSSSPSRSPRTLRSASRSLRSSCAIFGGAHTMSPQGFERIQGLRRVVYDSQDYQEGICAFKEKRRPVFRGE